MGSRVRVGMLELFPNTTGQVPSGRRRGRFHFYSGISVPVCLGNDETGREECAQIYI